MAHLCSRTLDKPVLLFGLEVEDVSIIAAILGVGGLIVGPTIPGVISVVAWVMLATFKRDKPLGYLLHWLYSKGVAFPGLILPLGKIRRYSV